MAHQGFPLTKAGGQQVAVPARRNQGLPGEDPWASSLPAISTVLPLRHTGRKFS